MKVFWIVLIAAAAVAGLTLFVYYYIGILENVHTKPKPKPGQIRVACVGDSITHGAMIVNRAKNSYPRRLQKLLGSGYCVGNFGFSARTASENGDHPYMKENLFRESLAFQPNIVLVMLGTNDSKPYNWNEEAFQSSMRKLIESYAALNTKPEICLIAPPPAFPVRGKILYDVQDDVIKNKVGPAVKRLAEGFGFKCLDMYPVFDGKKQLFADGVHPNKKGALLFAQNVFKYI